MPPIDRSFPVIAFETHLLPRRPTHTHRAANVLAWEELACHVPDRRHKGQEVTLLQGVCGVARSGDLMAIIGKHAIAGVAVNPP